MLDDATSVAPGATLNADVCIIGAGAAGICIANEFVGTSKKIILLEGGGRKPDAASRELYKGVVKGKPRYFPLESCRTRAFGGSTHCWAGMCSPLNRVDFTKRSWVPNSGWPITRETLAQFYARAQTTVGLGPVGYSGWRWRAPGGEPFPFPKHAALRNEVFQLAGARRRFHKTYGKRLEDAENIRVFLHANLGQIELAPGGAVVEGVEVRRPNSRTFRVRARRYVLATGGIENARLLLASNGVEAKGVGNRHDVVGRYFMEHPHTDWEGLLLLHRWTKTTTFYARSKRKAAQAGRGGKNPVTDVWGVVRPTELAMEQEKILNFGCVLFPAELTDKVRTEHPLIDEVFGAVSELDGIRTERRPLPQADSARLFRMGTPTEQAPNPESRITLSPTVKDTLGMPRAQLRWQLTDLDRRTFTRAHALVGQAFAALGAGRMRRTVKDEDPFPSQMRGGNHHMGSTRMHTDPKQGVVDAECFVHGVENLAVAGSSVFTTSGAANPTLTLLALALRLADRLKKDLT